MAKELDRAGQVVGKDGKTRHRMSNELRSGAWGAMEISVNTLIDDLLWPNAEVTRTIASVVKGDLSQAMAARGRRASAEGRVPALRDDRERDDRADERVHLRSDARGARGRYRRQARWSGRRAGRRRHVERPHRQRELDGRQPDRPGAQHRRSGHRHRERRLVTQDHGGRARRNSAAEGSHQHDGGPASLVRIRSDARGARGRYRRQARWSGHRAGRRGHVEGLDRVRERDGLEPHVARSETSPK